MSVPRRFYGPALVATGPTTLYTVAAGTSQVIRLIHVANTSGTAATLTVSIGADAAGTRVIAAESILANATKEYWLYEPAVAAEIVTASAGTNNVLNITISGDHGVIGEFGIGVA
jgi:hypothetical protein